MIRYAADECFNGAIVRGLLRRGIDVVRVQDVGLRAESDLRILDWASAAGRILLTPDMATLIGSAYDVVAAGTAMIGVIAVPQSLSIGVTIDDLELVATWSDLEEWRNRVSYLPLP